MAKIVKEDTRIEILCKEDTCGKCTFEDGKNSRCKLFNRYLENYYDDDSAFPFKRAMRRMQTSGG